MIVDITLIILGLNIIGAFINIILGLRNGRRGGALAWFSALLGWVVATINYLN